MNILILQTKAFPHRSNSFYWFYTQLTEWLTAHGYPSILYFAYLDVDDYGFENGLLLPDKVPHFYTQQNIETLSTYITDKRIDVILDYSHIITGRTRLFFLEIKRLHPDLRIFTMIHNCPSHTTQLKQYEISRLRLKDVRSVKQFVQWSMPEIYLRLLKREVKKQNISAYDTLDEIVLLSPSYIPEFKKLINRPDANRLSAIPNAIRPVESQIPIQKKNKEIIFVGRIENEKALPKLLKIWEMVQDRLPDWNLIIVGDDSKREECRSIIERRKLKRTEIKEYQMAIPLIDQASILCLTSVIEGLPTVFTEAMSLGVVPIGFDSFRAIYDMIEDGKNGFIIPNNDYRQYAETLYRLASDDRLRQQMAQHALSKKDKYSIESIAPLWLETFKKHGLA